MSSCTAIHADFPLKASFKAATESGGAKRAIVVKINNEVAQEAGSLPLGPALQDDYQHIAGLADGACYILVRLEVPRKWLLITHIPEDAPPKDKMVYAATRGTLQEDLGNNLFVDALQTSTLDELSWANYAASHANVPAYSTGELLQQKIREQEDQERAERATARTKHVDSGGRPLSGGYHAVAVTLEGGSCTAALAAFNSGQSNFVELAITDNKTSVAARCHKQIAPGQLQDNISATEPRYYLYRSAPAVGVPKVVMLYCCPHKSPPNQRMVYSTAKGSVSDELGRAGVRVDKSLEFGDHADITDAAVRESLVPLPRSAGSAGGAGGAAFGRGQLRPVGAAGPGGPRNSWAGSTTPAAQTGNVKRVGGAEQHPVYALMGGTQSGNRKKIVLPPSGAW